MTQNFEGKTALITGASRGIGAAVAKGLAKQGAHVILLARTQGGLEETDDAIRENGGQATLMPMDLMKLEKIDQLSRAILDKFGGLDILVGNAGILGTLTPAHQVEPKDFQKVMLTNYAANVRLVRALDPLLRESEAGRVVFTTAAYKYSTEGLPYWGAYMASKAALNVFAKTYAKETRRTNIKTNMIYPGPTETKLLDTAFPGGFKGQSKTAEELVPTYLKLCSAEYKNSGELVEV